ncbi:MAG: hypothetical protein IRY84_08845 [Thermobispora bispora]|nr:hypothetical protein [Thermobispora bispora]
MSRHKDEEILASSPFEDDFQSALAQQGARGRPSKVTLALAAGLLLVTGVFIGIRLHASFGQQDGARTQSAAANRDTAQGGAGSGPGGMGQAGGPAGANDRTGGSGRSGGPGGGEPMTFGTVTKVEGDKVYVRTMDGREVTVRTSDGTQIRVSKPGKVTDLEAGTTVVVAGAAGADGTVNATSISENPMMGRRPGS